MALASLVAYCTDAAALEPLLRTTVMVTLPALCAAEYAAADNCTVSGSLAVGGFGVGGAGDEGGGLAGGVAELPPPQPASAQAPTAAQVIQAVLPKIRMTCVLAANGLVNKCRHRTTSLCNFRAV
jgi:hypothetical protein